MKKLLMMLLMIGILVVSGNTANARNQKVYVTSGSIGAADAMGAVVIGMIDKVVVGNRTYTIDPAAVGDRFLQQVQSIEAIRQYNHDYIASPYQIGSIPTNQYDWMKWHVMNIKLGKYLAR